MKEKKTYEVYDNHFFLQGKYLTTLKLGDYLLRATKKHLHPT